MMSLTQKKLKKLYGSSDYYKVLMTTLFKWILSFCWCHSKGDHKELIKELDNKFFDFLDDEFTDEEMSKYMDNSYRFATSNIQVTLEEHAKVFGEFHTRILRSGFTEDMFNINKILEILRMIALDFLSVIREYSQHHPDFLTQVELDSLEFVHIIATFAYAILDENVKHDFIDGAPSVDEPLNIKALTDVLFIRMVETIHSRPEEISIYMVIPNIFQSAINMLNTSTSNLNRKLECEQDMVRKDTNGIEEFRKKSAQVFKYFPDLWA